MKKLLLVLTSAMFLASCGETKVEAKKIQEYVKPVATFMNGTPGVQLFSYFDQDTYKEEKINLEGMVCSQGSYGKDAAIFLCDFDVGGVTFEPFVTVSKEDQEKVKEALKAAEKEGKEEINVVFEAKLVKEGSMKSPFGGEIKLKFAEGKVLSI